MSDDNFVVSDALKAAQWERCKGELRALAVMQGCYISATNTLDDFTGRRFAALSDAVEKFIKMIEEEGLYE